MDHCCNRHASACATRPTSPTWGAMEGYRGDDDAAEPDGHAATVQCTAGRRCDRGDASRLWESVGGVLTPSPAEPPPQPDPGSVQNKCRLPTGSGAPVPPNSLRSAPRLSAPLRSSPARSPRGRGATCENPRRRASPDAGARCAEATRRRCGWGPQPVQGGTTEPLRSLRPPPARLSIRRSRPSWARHHKGSLAPDSVLPVPLVGSRIVHRRDPHCHPRLRFCFSPKPEVSTPWRSVRPTLAPRPHVGSHGGGHRRGNPVQSPHRAHCGQLCNSAVGQRQPGLGVVRTVPAGDAAAAVIGLSGWGGSIPGCSPSDRARVFLGGMGIAVPLITRRSFADLWLTARTHRRRPLTWPLAIV